jgi:polyhydroxyalkanoate synthesis regulator phasin
MAQNDMLRRYLDAGMAFTQLTRARAEGIVKDLVKAGEVQREQTQDRVEDLLERSRKNTDALRDLVRKEIREQLASVGLATKDDIARLERKLGAGTPAAKKAAPVAKPAAAKKAAPAKKGVASKAGGATKA